MLDPSLHIGKTLRSVEPYLVSRDKILEFTRALGDDNPLYQGPDPTAPPTFAAVLTVRAWQQLIDDPELGLALKRIIHADQEFTWHRLFRVGDVISTVTVLEDLRIRGGMDYMTVVVHVLDQDEAEVVQSRSLLIHKHAEEAAA
ncbi:MAG: MaoC family dehydratase N-terminal domain-containing protein [Propionibacteriaceae bacterium]|jgi:acyl dehydratase|nr:MaoC family dehydratase N-terminal domain-containing protein [Propionibacteriaceae bacterium]